MFNPINPSNVNKHPSIETLAQLLPEAMIVIGRHKSITGIGRYERTLGPKVGQFEQAHTERSTLMRAYKELASLSAVEIDGLDAVTRVWGANIQLGTPFDAADIGIVEARTPEAAFYNARNVMQMLREHGDLALAAEALSELETKYSSATAAYEAAQEGRVAMQAKQRELQAVAADVHAELVKLRRVLRIALGSSHVDYRRLRVRSVRANSEVPGESTQAPAQTATPRPSTTPSD